MTYVYFEACQKKMEAHEKLGGKNNKYTSANAATDITSGIQDAVAVVVSKSNKETIMAVA